MIIRPQQKMALLKSPISAGATSTVAGPPTTVTRATSFGATPPGQSSVENILPKIIAVKKRHKKGPKRISGLPYCELKEPHPYG